MGRGKEAILARSAMWRLSCWLLVPFVLAGCEPVSQQQVLDDAAVLPDAQDLPADILPAPAHLHLTSRLRRPPQYDLRWTMPETAAVDHFVVYRSTAAITSDNRADAAATLVPGASRSLLVEILPDSGIQFFRVSAVDADGAESPLSPEFALDTTSRVAFRADKRIPGLFELFSTLPDGSEPTRVSGALHRRTVISGNFTWSPDARRLGWLANRNYAGTDELFVAPADGSRPPVKVSGPLVRHANVIAYGWSPDAASLAFIADRQLDEVYDLYVTPADRRLPPSRVSGAMVAREGTRSGVSALAWSPDATQIAFTADRRFAGIPELYVVNVDDGLPRLVASAIGNRDSGSLGVQEFAWSPDGTTLAYLADEDRPGVPELFTVPASGGLSAKVGNLIIPNSSVQEFLWSPASDRIAFVADRTILGLRELYVAPAQGGDLLKVSGPIVTGGSVLKGIRWSRDASLIAFRAEADVPGIVAVYVVSPDGGPVVKVSGSQLPDVAIYEDLAWSPASTLLAARMDDSIKDNVELLVFDPIGQASPVTPQPLLLDREVTAFTWSADGSRLAYVANQDRPGVRELFVTPAAAGDLSTRISGFVITDGNVFEAAWSPLGN